MAPRRIRFAEIANEIPEDVAGIYEIHTDDGVPLKVGIGRDLRRRLRQHHASRDSGLKLKRRGAYRENPANVVSKASILAKHLYYDEALTTKYDLKTEAGRRAFLENQCYIMYEIVTDIEVMGAEEHRRELEGCFRYVGTVVKRSRKESRGR